MNAAGDDDNDGLNNMVELSLWQYNADPYYQDIFVEVDWMPRVCTLSLEDSCVRWDKHNFEPEAQAKVIAAFANHGITLHIDDGWMGGGNEVPHVDWIKFSEGNWGTGHNVWDEDGDGNPDAPGNRDDFYDFKYGEDNNFNGILDPGEDRNGNGVIDTYFSFGRQNIFHYALFTHETESWWANQWFRNAAGWGEWGVPGLQEGNDFIVTKQASSQESVFMHELGHNLGLPHSSGNTAMTGTESGIVDYLPAEWSALNLVLVVGGD